MIVVGAQAIFVHTAGDPVGLAIPPFTYDANIATNPELLGNSPPIVDAMRGTAFQSAAQLGLYTRGGRSQADLLVTQAVGGPDRRAARLGSARMATGQPPTVHGLEGARGSHSRATVTLLVPDADRTRIVMWPDRPRWWWRMCTRSGTESKIRMSAVTVRSLTTPQTSIGSCERLNLPSWRRSSLYFSRIGLRAR